MTLTKAYEPDLQAQMDATPPGMAFWVGTGPAGTMCYQCFNWGSTQAKSGPTYKRNEAGVLKPKRCYTYTILNSGQHTATGIPAITPSCKAFQSALNRPTLHRETKP